MTTLDEANGGGERAFVQQITLPVGAEAVHEVRGAAGAPPREVKLVHGQPTEMPMQDAYTFLRDPAFVVSDKNGEIIKPVSTNRPEAGRVELAENEVIANYDELKNDSLLKRCKLIMGSEKFTTTTKKSILVEFLIAANAKVEVGIARGSDDPLMPQEMPANALDDILPDMMERVG